MYPNHLHGEYDGDGNVRDGKGDPRLLLLRAPQLHLVEKGAEQRQMEYQQVENAENFCFIQPQKKSLQKGKEPENVGIEGGKNCSPHNCAPCKDVTNVARQNLT